MKETGFALKIAALTAAFFFCMAVPLFSQVSFYSNDPSGIRIYDERGILQRNISAVDTLKPGWIVQTVTQTVELSSGDIRAKASPGSLFIVEQADEFVLLRGTLRGTSLHEEAIITLSTPDASYTLSWGDVILQLSPSELLTVIEGTVTVEHALLVKSIVQNQEEA